jgi:hypothetical protein
MSTIEPDPFYEDDEDEDEIPDEHVTDPYDPREPDEV